MGVKPENLWWGCAVNLVPRVLSYHDRRIHVFVKGEARRQVSGFEPRVLKLLSMFILLMSNLSSLTLNPVHPKWTPNVVVIHVHCRKHIYQNNRLEKFCVEASPFVFNFSRPSE